MQQVIKKLKSRKRAKPKLVNKNLLISNVVDKKTKIIRDKTKK